jgi:hypothetical protein
MNLEPDPIYIEARNSLLKEAELASNRHCDKLGLTNIHATYNQVWSTYYHNSVNSMWKRRGRKLMKEFARRGI